MEEDKLEVQRSVVVTLLHHLLHHSAEDRFVLDLVRRRNDEATAQCKDMPLLHFIPHFLGGDGATDESIRGLGFAKSISMLFPECGSDEVHEVAEEC
jgi:hypothetical protein